MASTYRELLYMSGSKDLAVLFWQSCSSLKEKPAAVNLMSWLLAKEVTRWPQRPHPRSCFCTHQGANDVPVKWVNCVSCQVIWCSLQKRGAGTSHSCCSSVKEPLTVMYP